MSQQRSRHPDPRDETGEAPSSGLSVTSSEGEAAGGRAESESEGSDGSSSLYAKTKKKPKSALEEARNSITRPDRYVKNSAAYRRRTSSQSGRTEERGGPPPPDPRRHSLSELDVERINRGLLAVTAGGTGHRSIRSNGPPLPPPPPPMDEFQAPAKPKKGKGRKERGKVYRVAGLGWIERALRSGLWALGQAVVRLPGLMLLFPLLLVALCLIPMVVNKASLTSLSSPFPSLASSERLAAVEPESSRPAAFNASNPRFASLDKGSPADFAVLLQSPKGTTVLREEVIDVYLRLKRAMEEIEVRDGSKVLKYSTLCREPEPVCRSDVVEMIMGKGLSVDLTYPETFLPAASEENVTKLYLASTFGGVETDPDGAIARARALAMYFRLKPGAPKLLLSEWDSAFQSVLGNLTQSDGVGVSAWSHGQFSDTVQDTLGKAWAYLGYSALITLALCAFGALRLSSYRSRPILGFLLGLAVALSALCGVSLRMSSGELNAAAFPALFSLVATGILLLGGLMQSWGKFSNAAIHPREKLQFLLSWDGPLVVAVTVVGVVAFAITGAASSLPYFKELCLILAAGLATLLVLGLSFFAAGLYLAGRRESAGLKWFHFWKHGDTHFPLPLTKDFDEKNIQRLHTKLIDEQPSPVRAVGTALSKVHLRYVALMGIAVYAIFGLWGCSVGRIGLEQSEFVPRGSGAAAFLSDFGHFFGRTEAQLELVFEDTIDYMDPDTRLAILDMLDWAQESAFATRVVSWLRDFLLFEQASIYLVNRDTFVPVVHLIFLTTQPYTDYAADIAFDQYQAQIIASRMYLQLSHRGLQDHRELINGLLARAKAAGLPLRVKAPSVFLLDHDIGLPTLLILALLIPAFLLSVLGGIAFAQPLVGIATFFCLSSVAVGSVGYGSLWGVPVNAVTGGAVLSGLVHTAAAVFSLCHHFAASGARKSARSRLEYAVQSSLWPLLLSCLIPLVAFLPLLSLDAPILTHLGKMLLLQLGFTALHALLFLPALLVAATLHLPHCCRVMKELCEDSACVCCDSEEDATSIYYIPTTGRSVDPEMIQRFFGNRALSYIDEGMVEGHYALPPPARREMIMPPPPRGYDRPDLVGGYERDEPPRVHSRASSIRSRRRQPRPITPAGDERLGTGRRSLSQSEAGGARPLSPSQLGSSRRQRSLARSERSERAAEERRTYFEDAEPRTDSPASVAESGSVYVVQDKELRHVPRHFRRATAGPPDQRNRAYASARWARDPPPPTHPADMYPPPHHGYMEDMRGGWMGPPERRRRGPPPFGHPGDFGPPPYGEPMPPPFRGPRPLPPRASMRAPPPRGAPW